MFTYKAASINRAFGWQERQPLSWAPSFAFVSGGMSPLHRVPGGRLDENVILVVFSWESVLYSTNL